MAPATHSLEADLRAAREAADIAIEDIHRETRLATNIIQRFENGQLIGDPSFNAVYLKAFLRSYAVAVGVSPHKAVTALEAVNAGTYHGELHPNFGEPAAKRAEEETNTAESEWGLAETEPADVNTETLAQKETPFPKVDPLPPAIPASSAAFSGPSTVPYEGARPTRRLRKKAPTNSGRSFDTAWGAILGVTVLIVLAVFAVLWLLFRNDSPEPDVAASYAADSAEVFAADGASRDGTPAQTSAPQLAFPIQITVDAGGDGLQSFLVTQAPDERRPFWVEPGESVSFSSSESIVLWGQGGGGMNPTEVTLRFQGYVWTPAPGQVLRIDRTKGQALLDSLHAVFPAGRNSAPQP